MRRDTVHDGAHDRIVREALGVIHVLVSGEPTEHRLAKKSHEEMSDVLAVPRLRQDHSAQLGQSKRVVQFPIREQAGIGGDVAAMEFQFEALPEAVKHWSLTTLRE